MLLACGSDRDEGTIMVTAYGEAFIEEGIPESAMEDGWEIVFDRFDVEVTDITLAGVALEDPGVVDLTENSSGEGQELGSLLAPAGEHTDGGFTIQHMDVRGSAVKDGSEKRFSWTFAEPVRYGECDTVTALSDGGAATFQITVHADHFVYDSLAQEEPKLRFQALADADGDGDGDISLEELKTADIGAYDPGSEGGVDDLWSYLVAASRTLGHVDGEGHCQAQPAGS